MNKERKRDTPGQLFVPFACRRLTYAWDEDEARHMARRLAKEEGILAGTSTGMNVLAACELAKEFGPGHNLITVAVDTGLKYRAGDLYSEASV